MRMLALKFFIAFAILTMIAWMGFVKFYASFEAKEIVAIYNLDKLLHIIGGAFIAASIIFLDGQKTFWRMLWYLLIAAAVWELGELVFDGEVGRVYVWNQERWIRETRMDYIASVTGGIAFWFIFLRNFRKE